MQLGDKEFKRMELICASQTIQLALEIYQIDRNKCCTQHTYIILCFAGSIIYIIHLCIIDCLRIRLAATSAKLSNKIKSNPLRLRNVHSIVFGKGGLLAY